ncbi:hypothetical protein [Pseudomonas veronii]
MATSTAHPSRFAMSLAELQSQPAAARRGKAQTRSHFDFTRHAAFLALLGELGGDFQEFARSVAHWRTIEQKFRMLTSSTPTLQVLS